MLNEMKARFAEDYKIKSYVMLSIIFVLGFLTGMLVKDLITESPFDQVRNLRQKGGFAMRLENVLDLNEKQKEEIRPILNKYEKGFFEHAKVRMTEIRLFIDSLKTDLKPYLSEEQIQKMEKEFMPPPPDGRIKLFFEKPVEP